MSNRTFPTQPKTVKPVKTAFRVIKTQIPV